MSVSDSTFLLDVRVEYLVPLGDDKELRIKTKCADLFEVELHDLKEFNRNWQTDNYITQSQEKKCRKESFLPHKDIRKKLGETIILVNNANKIISNMESRHLEVYLWNNINPDDKLRISRIPWTQNFIKYVENIHKTPKLPPVVHNEVCDVGDEIQRRCLGNVTVTVKLICLCSHFYKFISRSKRSIYMYTCLFSNPEKIIKLNNLIKNSNKCVGDLGTVTPIRESKPNYSKHVLEENKEVKVEEQKFSFKENIKANSALENTRTKLEEAVGQTKYNPYDYIFGDPNAAFHNRIYCVNYFTTNKSNQNSKQSSVNSATSEKSVERKILHIKQCNSKCLKKSHSVCNVTSTNSLDLPLNVDNSLVKIISCKEISCASRIHRKLTAPVNNTLSLDFSNIHKSCCHRRELTQNIEEVRGEVSANIKYGDDPCFCSCECQFEFIKKTTFCKICGGYEIVGEEFIDKRGLEIPMPCPIYHKLVDKNKLKAQSTSGSELKRKLNDSLRSIKLGSSQKASSEKRLGVSDKKSVESEKDSKKEKKKKKDDRFKFNYGYKAPQIGHSQCTSPCTGTLENVPKNMGWLWTANCIPGMKFRPMWKPGATNKQVVRLLRIAKNPEEALSKKKKKDVGKQKRPLKRPLLTVHKKNGEYTVTMETLKSYSRPRAVHQYPYENKPVLTYTIGRTEEENKERQKKKEREQRRLERAQRMYVQSAFKNMCNEICMKTYQQALGILPNAEDPQCPCYPSLVTTDEPDKSCSCSEDNSISGSDTDSDEWLVEFTPPNALFNPSQKVKKTTTLDNGSQYTYLDYRVKLLDRFGNPVPRFFKGPDGKEQCSDLGGFWTPDHKWLEINVHGYIGPDGRWAPNSFIGPSGDTVDAETGKFQDKHGQWLVVGTDGYINSQGKWCFYPKYRRAATQRKRFITTKGQRASNKKVDKEQYHSESSWSCFGDASPNQLSRLGIIGHGRDKKFLVSKLQDMVARGQNVKIPQQSPVFRLPHQGEKANKSVHKKYNEEVKCTHPLPSNKGIVAVNADGDKTYFRLKHNDNKRPGERISTLTTLGISLSSFHVPCFSSFIKSEMIKQGHNVLERASTDKTTETHVEYINR